MPPGSHIALLRHRDIARLLLAASAARLAERMLMLVLVLYALARFHSPGLAGWIAFAAMTPGLLVSPIAGALLDRFGSAVSIAIDMACSAGFVGVLALLARHHVDSPAIVLVLVALFSLSSPLSYAGVRTLLPALTPRAALDRANALDTSIHAIVDVIGPALGGALFGFAGAIAALLVVAGLYGVGCISLLGVAQGPRPMRTVSLLRDAAAGVGHVLRHASLRPLAVTYALYQVAWGVLVVAVPVWVTRTLGGSAHADVTVGGLWALAGLASGAGALAAGWIGAFGRERSIIACGVLATAAAIYPISICFGMFGLGIGLALTGLLAGPIDVGVLTLRQRRTDPRWLGRAIAVSMSLNLSGLPLGSALGGWLCTMSLTAAFVAGAIACVAAGAAALAIPKR